ncbi:MAG: hypothetical protein HUU02_03810 [Bacteroidetes bacterium]|nr:hypothetical protein [Bacteroidota bacterium]
MTIPVFAHVAAVSCFIPAAVGLWYWKQSPAAMRVFTLFCLYSTLHLVMEFTLGRLGISNQFLMNYHQIIELLCILYLFHARVTERRTQLFFRALAALYSVLWLVNKFLYEDPERFSEGITIAAMLVLMTASVIVLNMSVRTAAGPVTQHSTFWIALAVLLYGAGTVIITGFSNTILAMGMEAFDTFWHINWGFTILTNLLYARSFRCPSF